MVIDMYLYKKSDIFKELDKDELNYLRNSSFNINADMKELINILNEEIENKGIISKDELLIKNIIKKLSSIDLNKYNKVIFVDPYGRDDFIYYCTSDVDYIQIGDDVCFKKNHSVLSLEDEGIVREVGYYKTDNLPMTLDNMYVVTEVTYRGDEDDE